MTDIPTDTDQPRPSFVISHDGLPGGLNDLGQMRDLLAGAPRTARPVICGGTLAPWLLALYHVARPAEGASERGLMVSRIGHSFCPVREQLRLVAEAADWGAQAMPGWRMMTLAPDPAGAARQLAAGVLLAEELKRRCKATEYRSMVATIDLLDVDHRSDLMLNAMLRHVLCRNAELQFSSQLHDVSNFPEKDVRQIMERLPAERQALLRDEGPRRETVSTMGKPADPGRDGNALQKYFLALREAAKRRVNLMGPSIACARAGATTDEWSEVIRSAFTPIVRPANNWSDGNIGQFLRKFN
ncbi:hypothetical protein [Pseudoroseicyclus aestuarii]|uniref:Uncharacterized protein n=1 Tax=Pseudoroseicyclus aestuarii TaxID=1795041 RepID=A0A318STT5_9RHOB|nr:hypothetical protein [Pseudoroseicyclus aestuarii]PYE84765.1 hypothetical protein DFP88_102568 [Pseudoroseicyclus aestuarii]